MKMPRISPPRFDRFGLVLTLAFRNVLRQRARTGMTLAAISLGIAGLILSGGFVGDLIVQLREAVIHSQTGHIQLAARDYFSIGSRSPEKYLMKDPGNLERTLREDSRVIDVMARMSFAGLLNNGRTDLPIAGEGVEPSKESRLGSYLFIESGRAMADGDRNGVMVGRSLANSLALTPGSNVTLVASTPDGAMNTLDLEVIGIFQSYSRDYDARVIRIHLDAARELLGSNGAHLLVLSLAKSDDTDAVRARVEPIAAARGLEVKSWNELSDFYEKTVALYDRQFGVLRLIVLVMVLMGVANSVNMSVFERVGEFGTMRALGNRDGELVNLLLTEALVLGVLGALLGLVLGLIAAGLVSWIGIPMPPPPNSDLGYTARIRLDATSVLGAAAIGFVATVLAFVPAALRATKVEVVEALRQNH
jgi:putative ABC transport system permease protein